MERGVGVCNRIIGRSLDLGFRMKPIERGKVTGNVSEWDFEREARQRKRERRGFKAEKVREYQDREWRDWRTELACVED